MSFVRILVVEDHAQFRQYICSLLGLRGELQIISEVSDGLEAVQKAQQLQPDLILLDIGLPMLNGIEVARRAQLVAPDAKLLFVSQESSCDVVQETFRLGAQGYVHKPHARRDLLSAIDEVLNGKRFVSSSLACSEGADTQTPPRHEILFCSDNSVLLDSLTRFVGDALAVGNPALLVATQSHLASLVERLHIEGVDFDAAIQRGTCVTLDAYEVLNEDRVLDAIGRVIDAAAKAGKKHPRVAWWGERAGLLWAAGAADEAIQREQFASEVARSYPVDILCPYPSPNSLEDDPALQRICAEHTNDCSR